MAMSAIQIPRSSTPPRRPARTAEASVREAPSPSKWGEVVSSLPLVRLSEQSSLGSPDKRLGFSPSVAFQEPLVRPEPISATSTPLWSPEPKAKVTPPLKQNDFWRAHEQYALQRSRESTAKLPSLSEPQQRTERPELAGRSALEGRRLVQSPKPALHQYLPVPSGEPVSSPDPRGQCQASPEAEDARAVEMPQPDSVYEQLLQEIAKRLTAPSQEVARANQMARAAWDQAAATQPQEDPWRKQPDSSDSFCLSEMLDFLQRRVEVQSRQMRQLKAELAARSRLARTFQG
ncbi:unnamed protein product [Effrenium voratum]|nr:unnamed protein product [Effrenium voratum]